MRISRNACFGAVAAAALIASAALSAAQASTILTFGQAGGGDTTTITDTAGTTTIVDSNVGVTVTQILAGVSTPFSAFFNLTATSIGSAVTVLGTIVQRFTGTFSVTSASCGTGNCLSGTFSDVVGGPNLGTGAYSECRRATGYGHVYLGCYHATWAATRYGTQPSRVCRVPFQSRRTVQSRRTLHHPFPGTLALHRFPAHSHSLRPASARWVCSAGARSVGLRPTRCLLRPLENSLIAQQIVAPRSQDRGASFCALP